MAHVSPIRVIRRTRAYLPIVVLTVAVILLGISATKARQAHLLETEGVTGEATVVRKERRVSRDSDGNETVRLYVSYRFTPAAGATISKRLRVGSRFYNSVREGQRIPVRYVPDRPSVHEIDIGGTRRDAENMLMMGGAALAGAGGLAVWIAKSWMPLFRAIFRGSERPARVVGHIQKPSRRKETGGRYGKIVWRDETGVEGTSGYVPMLDVVSHPVGSRIMLIVDPTTGQCYWDEEFGDDTVALLQRG